MTDRLMKEVFGVIYGFNGDKASGPSRFSMAFFQQCWSILKDEILVVFQNFHTLGIFDRSLNETFLVLIPKIVMLWW